MVTVVLAAFAVVGVVTGGGEDSSTPNGPTPTPGSPLGDLRGEFLVSGSSTVFPIVLRQAEEFAAMAPGVAIAVEGPGSGDGARKFCAGEVPIANASRLLKDEEIEVCEEAGIEFIELRRGVDGISVVTSVENDAVECLSFNDLYALLSGEAQGFGSWADANALTGSWSGRSFPDVELDVYGPGEESGTFDSFAEIVIEGVVQGKTGLDVEGRELAEDIRPDYTSSPDDNVIIDGIAGSEYSLGWIGFSFADQAARAGRISLLAISYTDGGECVVPSPESISSAEFPISRFLYTYVNAQAASEDPAVAAFVDYMLSAEGLEAVAAAGYVDLSTVDQARSQAIWTDRATGRAWE